VPDGSLLVADPTIKMPFADVQVSFQNFMFLAPVLLRAYLKTSARFSTM
jgi:hypothetical protein